MSAQPEALRLADELDADRNWLAARGMHQQSMSEAAELRRLHELLEAEQTLHQRVIYPELQRLRAQRDALLEALNAMLTHMGMDEDEWNKPTFDQARAAIAKAGRTRRHQDGGGNQMTQITIDRALVEQALEALEKSVAAMRGLYGGWRCESALKQADTQITALRAVLAQQDEPETCTWYQDGDSDSGVYATSCGHYFNLEDGAPEDNRMQWCRYCGKKLAQELITEDSDD